LVMGTISSKEQKLGSRKEEIRALPPIEQTVGRKKGDYTLVGKDGLIEVGVAVQSDTILIGKVLPLDGDEPRFRDNSVLMKSMEHGIIDRVMVTNEDESMKSVKVRYRKNCIPEEGDKLASRHGQKGTIGTIVPPEDLPFTGCGIIPDVVANGLAFTSRMTFG